jgi:PmbA protein
MDTLSSLLSKARAYGADSADALLVETVEVSVAERLGKPEGLERSENQAVGLRAFVGQKQAIVSATDLAESSLDQLAVRAVAMAKAAPPDPDASLAPPQLLAKTFPELDLLDPVEPETSWLERQCKIAEDAALSVAGITNSEGAHAHYSRSRVSLAIAGSGGVIFEHSYPTSHFSLSVSVLAGSGTGMERDYEFSSAHHRADLWTPEKIGKEAARRTLARLNPCKARSAKVPVVFDPRVAKNLIAILATAISGAAIARGSSFLKDAMHEPIFPAGVTVIDDPHIKRGQGSKPFDGEGVRNGKRAVVENGTLKSWLLDIRTAAKLGLTTTGHASRGLASSPSPSPTNFYMQPGSLSPQELIKDIKSGFYVTETFGMGVNTTTGDYSQGASGLWIENGEIAYPVSEVTIAGSLRDMFAHATPASDLAFRYSINAPTIRIDSMTVAGV